MANTPGLRSPPTPRSEVSSPRPKFDSDLLKAYIKKLLSSTLNSASWPEAKDRDRVKTWMKEIGERVKERMLEIQPRGFKYIVLTQINENLGQGGRADMVSHWEDTDTVAQEVFVNDTLICICIAFAVRTQ
ncbi:tctex1 domain-containing protein 2 [Moniliophthora roreri MCA 2997]|uniref:Tctex1 domain-containing protein 2 n=2 Tax=Moniliophthora roreri TaxID=221103 RepID=V2XEG8_MONRO|nr:tctex1 domain-containing protein 2 [Moniliophthora roreri MCA 2997]